jgi:hypothetical protein
MEEKTKKGALNGYKRLSSMRLAPRNTAARCKVAGATQFGFAEQNAFGMQKKTYKLINS